MPIFLALLVLLLNMSAFRGSKVLVSLFALELGAPQIMLGVIVALYSLCPMLLALYAGKLADRFGVRWPLALGSLGMSLSLVLPGALPSLHMLYLSALLLGLSHVFYNISVQNLIGMLSSADTRTRNFSNLSLMIASGGFLGPLIAGFAIDTLGHAIGYLCIAVLPAVSAAIMFGARRYDSAEALAMGLVNRILPDADLDAYVQQVAAEFASNAPMTIAASKAVINALVEPAGDFSAVQAAILRCMKSEDYIEGRRAFMEKRKPVFKGR